MANLRETIRPSADLRNHYNEISKQCREEKEAVIITVHGKGDTVSLSFEEYQNMKAHIELLETLAEAEDDVKNGLVAPIKIPPNIIIDKLYHLMSINSILKPNIKMRKSV